MTDREKVVKGLECCVLFNGFECTNRNCPYWKECSAASASNELLHDVLDMLKAQEPRVMTLEEVVKSRHVILEDAEYTHMDAFVYPGWFGNNSIIHMRIYTHASAVDHAANDYNKTWRCWTSQPDQKTREETPWE